MITQRHHLPPTTTLPPPRGGGGGGGGSSTSSGGNSPHRRHQQVNTRSTSSTCCSTLVVIGIILIGIQVVVLLVGYRIYYYHGGLIDAAPNHIQNIMRNSNNKQQNPSTSAHDDDADTDDRPFPPNPDGNFNGYPIYYHDLNDPTTSSKFSYYNSPLSGNMKGPTSIVHCVGENYQSNSKIHKSWMHRSCHFQFMCFNISSNEFEIYQHPQETFIQKYKSQRDPFMDLSQSYYYDNITTTVSLGGINLKWGVGDKNDGVSRLEWFPKIVTNYQPTSFYTLPSNVVMIPFHSLAGQNPGHLVWDDFMSIYTLLYVFQLPNKHPLLLRYVLPPLPDEKEKGQQGGLWASCDYNDQKYHDCETMFRKFYPLMTTTSSFSSSTLSSLYLNKSNNTPIINKSPILTTQLGTQLQLFRDQDRHYEQDEEVQPKSNLICARHGAAGIGSLTDHGTDKFHGWHDKDYKTTHNHGRGGLFYKFRQHTVQNILGQRKRKQQESGNTDNDNHSNNIGGGGDISGPPYKIVFSKASSNNIHRTLDFSSQSVFLQQELIENNKQEEKNMANDKSNMSSSPNVDIQSYLFKEYTLEEQIEIVSDAAIYITGAGGGAVTASWLPKGSTVIIYYRETGGQEANKATGLPARLDWDYFNNIGYLRVHWLPSGTMNTYRDLVALLELVKHELQIIEREKQENQD